MSRLAQGVFLCGTASCTERLVPGALLDPAPASDWLQGFVGNLPVVGQQGRRPRRGGCQPRLRLLSLSLSLYVGNLSAFCGPHSNPILPVRVSHLMPKVCRKYSGRPEFTVAGWKAIVSASTARADGVMTRVHPKYVSTHIKFGEIVKGRVLRVQFQAPAGRVELLNVYQLVWNQTLTRDRNVEQRQKLLDKTARAVQSFSLRDTVVVAGDFNAELVQTPGVAGSAVANTPRHVGPDSPEPMALARFAESSSLVALNTWHCRPAHTFVSAQGRSQVDFIMCRSLCTDAVAKRCAPTPSPVGSWRDMPHRALTASVRILQHYHLP